MIHKKVWGHEKWLVNEPEYCGKLMQVRPGARCSLHFHKNKKETFYIISGKLAVTLHNWENATYSIKVLKAGQKITINPMTAHSFRVPRNHKTPCDFIEISTHHEEEDSYRLTPSRLDIQDMI